MISFPRKVFHNQLSRRDKSSVPVLIFLIANNLRRTFLTTIGIQIIDDLLIKPVVNDHKCGALRDERSLFRAIQSCWYSAVR